MGSRRTFFLTGIAILLMAGAFAVGTVVSADISGGVAPGSNADPLVSESYVKSKVASLEKKIAQLEEQIVKLESGSNKGVQTGSATVTQPVSNNYSNINSSNNSSSNILPTTSNSSTNANSNINTTIKKKVYILQLQTFANIRSAPNQSATIIIKVNSGANLDWLETSGEWFKVLLSDGRSGWVHNSVSELR
jgi:hypothetical protein